MVSVAPATRGAAATRAVPTTTERVPSTTEAVAAAESTGAVAATAKTMSSSEAGRATMTAPKRLKTAGPAGIAAKARNGRPVCLRGNAEAPAAAKARTRPRIRTGPVASICIELRVAAVRLGAAERSW